MYTFYIYGFRKSDVIMIQSIGYGINYIHDRWKRTYFSQAGPRTPCGYTFIIGRKQKC